MNEPSCGVTPLLRLHEKDNVLTALIPLRAGDRLCLEGAEYLVPDDLPIGHKLAARNISPGEKIIKYGAPIGSATSLIKRGEHVHTHNLQSDYLPGGEGEKSH